MTCSGSTHIHVLNNSKSVFSWTDQEPAASGKNDQPVVQILSQTHGRPIGLILFCLRLNPYIYIVYIYIYIYYYIHTIDCNDGKTQLV